MTVQRTSSDSCGRAHLELSREAEDLATQIRKTHRAAAIFLLYDAASHFVEHYVLVPARLCSNSHLGRIGNLDRLARHRPLTHAWIRDVQGLLSDMRLSAVEARHVAPPDRWIDDDVEWQRDLFAKIRAAVGLPIVQLARVPQRTTVIMFTDIVGSTEKTRARGNQRFHEQVGALRRVLRETISSFGGTPLAGRLLGDGVLAIFDSAEQAVEAAMKCAVAGDESDLPLRIGIHAGDVIREENDVLGDAVNVTARICSYSRPGVVYVSNTLRELASGSQIVQFSRVGRRKPKGMAEYITLYAVSLAD